MAGDEVVLDLARSLRPYLPELLAGDRAVDAAGLDDELAELLQAAGRGEPAADRILVVLRRSPAVHGWAAAFLEHGCPPDVAAIAERRQAGYSGLLGGGEPTAVPKFVCPHGDWVFYRRAVGQPVPPCRTHKVPLVSAVGR